MASPLPPRRWRISNQEYIEGLRTISRVPQKGWDKINPDLWMSPVTKDDLDEISATTYAARVLDDIYCYTREDVLLFFQEDFEGWDEEMFKMINPSWRHEMKIFLRERGIYTGPWKGHFIPQLSEIMKMERCPEWPAGEPRLPHPPSIRPQPPPVPPPTLPKAPPVLPLPLLQPQLPPMPPSSLASPAVEKDGQMHPQPQPSPALSPPAPPSMLPKLSPAPSPPVLPLLQPQLPPVLPLPPPRLPGTPALSMTEEKIQRAEMEPDSTKQKGQGAKIEKGQGTEMETIEPTAPGHTGYANRHLEPELGKNLTYVITWDPGGTMDC